MFDIITFGSATWDVFLKPKNYQELKNKKFIKGKGICFSLGSKLDVEEIHFFSGGGGTNTAATFVKQGFKTAYLGTVGNDLAGQEIIKELKKLGIDTRFVFRTNLKPTNYSVIFNTGLKRNRTVLAYRGASELLTKKDIPWKKLKAKWFYLAPLSGNAARLTEKIISFAKKNKIKLALNPGNFQLCLKNINKIIKKVDILILNKEEASLIGGFDKINKICPGIVIMGSSKGVKVSDGKYLYQAEVPKVKVVDRTGGGDAASSGFVSKYMIEDDMEYAVQFNTANAVSCFQKWGAKQGLLRKNEKFRKVKVNKIKL